MDQDLVDLKTREQKLTIYYTKYIQCVKVVFLLTANMQAQFQLFSNAKQLVGEP